MKPRGGSTIAFDKKDNAELIRHLEKGWRAGHSELPEDLAHRMASILGAQLRTKKAVDNSFSFQLDIDGIRLRGFNEVPCLVVAGDTASAAEAVNQFLRSRCQNDTVGLLLPVSAAAATACENEPRAKRCVALHPASIRRLLDHESPLECLKSEVRQQLPRRGLIPYTMSRPVSGSMFFGRKKELSRLKGSNQDNFAIAGPGRIGKSSLLHEYRRLLVRNSDERASRCFNINLYECDSSNDALARFIAMQIEPSYRTYRDDFQDLARFFHRQFSRHGGTLELLLDEVDEACTTKIFSVLTDIAREGDIRLVLAGRGNLLRAIMDQGTPLAGRYCLLQPEPLQEEQARDLIKQPLRDLGLRFSDERESIEIICAQTGRLPNLLQFYGQRLAEIAMDKEVDILTPEHLEEIKWKFETVQLFKSPVMGLKDEAAKKLAIEILKCSPNQLTVNQAQKMLERKGHTVDYSQAQKLCNDLLIDNVLAWEKGHYRVATQALVEYAKDARIA